jgi:hypothetical protein
MTTQKQTTLSTYEISSKDFGLLDETVYEALTIGLPFEDAMQELLTRRERWPEDVRVWWGNPIEFKQSSGAVLFVDRANDPQHVLKLLRKGCLSSAIELVAAARVQVLQKQNQLRGIVPTRSLGDAIHMQYEGMDLMEHMLQEKGDSRWTEARALHAVGTVAETLMELSVHGIHHMDVTLENLMVSTKDNGKLLLTDFGITFLTHANAPIAKCQIACGKLAYMAPEVIHANSFAPFDVALAQVFSLGVVLYCILFGKMPFNNVEDGLCQRRKCFNKFGMYWMLKNDGLHKSVSSDTVKLLQCMLHIDPTQRLRLQCIANLKHAK